MPRELNTGCQIVRAACYSLHHTTSLEVTAETDDGVGFPVKMSPEIVLHCELASQFSSDDGAERVKYSE